MRQNEAQEVRAGDTVVEHSWVSRTAAQDALVDRHDARFVIPQDVAKHFKSLLRARRPAFTAILRHDGDGGDELLEQLDRFTEQTGFGPVAAPLTPGTRVLCLELVRDYGLEEYRSALYGAAFHSDVNEPVPAN
jgi:hypothetical protein